MNSPAAPASALASWRAVLAARDDPRVPVELPEGEALAEALDALAIPGNDRPALLAWRDPIVGTPDLAWLVDRSARLLLAHMGAMERPPAFPDLAPELGEAGRYLYAWVYLAMLPHARAHARERGIPDTVTRATMADVGRHFLIHRAQHGTGGLAGPDWLMLHPRGAIFQLGRLQFERARLGGRTSEGIRAAGHDAGRGEPVLAVHIPGYLGPMTPEACDEAFALARAFFARHFPEERYRYATCHSWLLDPQYGEYLPATSNIIQFQQRWRSAYQPEANDRVALEFVFRTPDRPLDELPQRTTLERAVVRHLRAGRHWHGGAGWRTLD
jgi:hypothetical protein